ncbi:stage III sporulation protein AE [Sulfoacidibacillus thermotolerans]|uniref:Stage III sporulation protein AE n=1 Tax=Sulfoacidibacillus thermotolerans TaxID=1765684 RepID=A0A2U3DBZ9_SULT2|nr:stage III sporulation protein AE [Sulfoacidibacillus thermotolerans]PWI58792.1 stage III sporulation protein AE [Sulfoacidibacillus thermotolerans]
MRRAAQDFSHRKLARKILLMLFVFACLRVAPIAYASGSIPTVSGPPPPSASATPLQSATAQYQSVSQNAIEQAWNQLDTKYNGYIPTTSEGQLVPAFFPGNPSFHYRDLLQGLLRYLVNALLENLRLLGVLLILTVLASVLETVQSAFASQVAAKVGFWAVQLVLIVLAVSSFHDATQFASGAIDTMTAFMYGSLPVLLALIAASGGLTSAAAFHPMIVFIVNAMGLIVHNWVFPLIFFSAVLTIVSTISDRYKVTALAGFIKNVALAVLGLGMSAFLGIMSVQGSLTSISDGVALRSAKYVASNLVPVIGKALSDASESIAGASLIVKNATGMASAVLLLLICAFPALKILALSIVYNGSAALLQPLGDSPVIATLSTIGKSLGLVFAAVAAVGIMFFFSIVIAIAATNLTAFVR